MSYLMLPGGIPDFSKAIISFWFRVPKASLDAIAAAKAVMPLIMFGHDTVNGFALASETVVFGNYTREHWFSSGSTGLHANAIFHDQRKGARTTEGAVAPKKPCYIGIDSRAAERDRDPSQTPNTLRINVQLSGIGRGTGLSYDMASFTGPDLLVAYQPGGSVLGPREGTVVFSEPDVFGRSTLIVKEYNPFEEFQIFSDSTDAWMRSETETCKLNTTLEVKPDHWHHVLMSIDLTGVITATGMQDHIPAQGRITTDCRIWLAYDDVNIKGDDLFQGSYDTDYIEKVGDNDLFTVNATKIARFSSSPSSVTFGPYAVNGRVQITHTSGYTRPSYSYTPDSIHAAYPMGIPATAKYVDDIRKCEFAEFQMWTGITLDTAVVANRRAFVDKDGKPVSPDLAARLLNRKQAVLLHGSSNWQAGKNTGSIGITPAGELIEAGQFKRQGVINTYTPDPSLHGQQSPSPPPPAVRLTKVHAET